MESNNNPTYPINSSKVSTLVIHCSDPRFQTAFRRFVTEQLEIENYAPLVIGGSIHPYGAIERQTVQFAALSEQIGFFVTMFALKQIIVINHEDCAWYKSKKELASPIAPNKKCRDDLQLTVSTLCREFPDVSVRSFWAALDGPNIIISEDS